MPIYPTPRQWYLLAMYQRCPPPMHPALFLQHWVISYSELAQIAGVSRSTVDHWFSTGRSHREPAPLHCRQLAIVHRLWLHTERITPEMIQLWCNSLN